jgi:hypothetical protein
MNDHTRALLKESGLQPYYDAQIGAIEKFAELIAKECAELCMKDYWTRDGFGITSADARCADLIKQRFGIE